MTQCLCSLDHWTEEDHAEQDRCESMHHLAELGIKLAKRLKEQSPDGSVILLSGPMTTGGLGSFDRNIKLFECAIIVAREKGLTVYNQLPFQKGMIRILGLNRNPSFKAEAAGYPMSILTDFYGPLLDSKLVSDLFQLRDHASSFGARWEEARARLVEMIHIRSYPSLWYEEAMRRYRRLAA